jgi:hypothetical protein
MPMIWKGEASRKTNFPGVNLRIVRKSSPALIAQIETERAAGQHRVEAVPNVVVSMVTIAVARIFAPRDILEIR